LVTNCSINNNGDDGLYAFDSTISNTVAHNNTWHGFNLSGCVITRCTANYNGNSGIFSDIRSRIEGNNLRYNGYGLYLNGTKNYAIKNIGSDNTNGNFYDVQSGTPGGNYMPATVHNPPTTECSNNDNCGF